jgi:hemolysin-activating ACP:hemolysin acyltransferase
MSMKDEARLGLAILFAQWALISSNKEDSVLKSAKTGRHSLKWMS